MSDTPKKDPNETTRYSIQLNNAKQEQLASLAKQYKITQPEVIDAILTEIDMEKMGPVFAKVREDKVNRRESKKDLLERLSKMDPEELNKLAKLANTQ